MRVFGVLNSACLFSAMLFASPASELWRPPLPVPPGCGLVRFEAVLADISKSMNRGGLFEQSRKNIEDYLATAAPCTLLILGSFGVTADVVEAQFLVSADGRSRLVYALRGLRATHSSTNLDEAAKLIELLSYQLRDAYGTEADRLVVRVYSDFESSPSTGKPNFSLGEFLARRMDARYVRVDAQDNPGEQTANLQIGHAAERVPTPHPPESKKALRRVVLAIPACVLLPAGLVVLLWVRSHSRNSLPRGGGPAALLVTESAVPPEGGTPVAVGAERIPVAAHVPTVFSTDANTATYIAAVIPGAANGELFRLEPLPDGFVRIQSPHSRLLVNDQPLDADRRRKVDFREPIQIRLGPREFRIAGAFGSQQRVGNQRDELFEAEPLQH